ncbi:MAG TPA: hypothetical protein ENN08_00510, partial [Bacteroidales bacterium]|nr:hypothetical protein [Bacteroidales bacterium]
MTYAGVKTMQASCISTIKSLMLKLRDKMPAPKTLFLVKLVAITLSLGWSVCLPAQENKYVFLRNLGMHETAIIETDADAYGKSILTSSRGNSVKLWDAESGTLLRTFFSEDKTADNLPCAISPDGSTVAFGSQKLNAYSTRSGQLIFSDGHKGERITALKFSHDGKFLAVSIRDEGLRIYETENWVLEKMPEIENPGLSRMAFDVAGWLAVVTAGELLFFDNRFNLNKSTRFENKKHPVSLAISPGGSYFAIGSWNADFPEVYDSRSLEPAYSPKFDQSLPIAGSFRHVAYSKDSRYLYAAGDARIHESRESSDTAITGSPRNDVVLGRWSSMGRGGFTAIPTGSLQVSALMALPGGEIVIGSQGPEFIKLNPAGQEVFVIRPQSNRFADDDAVKLRVNANADEVLIFYQGQPPLRFSLKDRTLEHLTDSKTRTRFGPPQQSTPNIRLNLQSSDSILLKGETVPWLEPGEKVLSGDIADHGLCFVLGSNKNIYCAGRYGDLIWKLPVHVPARYVNISGNARVLVAALDDGSLRWYDTGSGQLLLSLFTYD